MARLRARLTQTMMGQLVGMTRVQVSRIENGKSIPSLKKVIEISVKLGCPISVTFQVTKRQYKPKKKFRKDLESFKPNH